MEKLRHAKEGKDERESRGVASIARRLNNATAFALGRASTRVSPVHESRIISISRGVSSLVPSAAIDGSARATIRIQ